MIGERTNWFKAQIALSQMDVSGHDIRWVGGDQLKCMRLFQGGIPVTADKLDSRAMTLGVGGSDLQGSGADIKRDHANVSAGVSDGHSNGARTGTHVECLGARRQTFQRQLNQQFRLWTRNQHVRCDQQWQTKELALTNNIGNRLALQTTLQ